MSLYDAVKVVVFDLDDTLCGYWDASKAALRTTFAEHPIEGQTVETMVRAWAIAFKEFCPTLKKTDWYPIYLQKGEPTRTEQMRLTLLRVGVDDPALARQIGDRYGQLRDQNLQLFPDALPLLQKLKGRFPMALMTNGPADIQRQEIETCGIEPFFDLFLIEGEMLEGKPNEAVFRRAETHFGVGHGELLMVGNSYAHDIRPAIEYGWQAIWIRRPSDLPPSDEFAGRGPEQRPKGAPEPTAEISELNQLEPMLGL